jgi:hypothetical protein
LQYYCIVNGEYRFSQNDGYDPETGEKLWPVTKEVIQKMKEKEKKAIEKKVFVDTVKIIKEEKPKEDYVPTVSPEEAAAAEAESLRRQREDGERREELARLKKELRHEQMASETKVKPVKEKITKDVWGYTISFWDNNNIGELDDASFSYDKNSTKDNYCKVTFFNNSRGTFKFYDSKKNLLFKVPPQKETTMSLPVDAYYFRANDSEKLIPFNLPNREKLLVRFLDNEDAAAGKIFFRHTNNGRNSGARIIGQEGIIEPDRSDFDRGSKTNGEYGGGGGAFGN